MANRKFGSVSIDTVPCSICQEPTSFTGTKLCNRCWELQRRIESDPELAQRILDAIKKGNKP